MSAAQGIQRRAADRIAAEAAKLEALASDAGFGFLAYLLAMVKVEAEEQRDRKADPAA